MTQRLHHSAIETWRIGIDIGGTFTDIVLAGSGGTQLRLKLPSTPSDYSVAIREGLLAVFAEHGIAGTDVTDVVHGTTVATNAILEGRGARTALITTLGFRDVLELRRIRLPELYNFDYRPPRPLVPRRWRFEVAERIGPRGEVRQALDLGTAEAALDAVAAAGVEALAISLLHSYVNADHEKRLLELAQRRLGDGVFLCCSSDVLPEIREYERTSTVVINAYVGPVVQRYVVALRHALRDIGIAAPLHIMQSNGGVLSAEAVLRKPAFIVESGPAAGVIAGVELAVAVGSPNLITVDMGGTTAKASMIEQFRLAKTASYEVGAGINISSQLVKGRGHALKLPVIDVSEIGAGGGSLILVDGGTLRVGPQSAGASPGPVCYGNGGTVPTLTDAMVVLGYINPHRLAGGTVSLDAAAARRAIAEQIAAPLGCDPLDAAYAAYVIAAATMTRAVKAVSTFRGRDPRAFKICAFGGNGPLMAAQIASELQIRDVLIPELPGLFSALGLLYAGLEHELSRTLLRRTDRMAPAELAGAFAELESRARAALLEEGCAPSQIVSRRMADLRYSGQAYELTVAVDDDARGRPDQLAEAFGQEHERTYGHRATDEPVDLVSIRVSAVQERQGLAVSRWRDPPDARAPERREVYFGRKPGLIMAAVLTRGDLGREDLGTEPRRGPLILEEYDATCLVPPGWSAALDAAGNIHLCFEGM